MPTEPELLQAVLAKPDDDAPRLEYAKWCEAQIDEPSRARATVIRNQITAVRTGRMFDRPAADADRLIERHGSRWHAALTPLVRQVEYRRGFVEAVKVTPNQWLENAKRIRSLAPVRHLDVVEAKPRFPDLITSPVMDGIRSLRVIREELDDRDAEALARSQHVLELRWLVLGENRLQEPGVVSIVQSTGLPSLKWASFYHNPFGPAEEHSFDQDVIVESWLTPEGVALETRFGRLDFLHCPANDRTTIIPDRFAI